MQRKQFAIQNSRVRIFPGRRHTRATGEYPDALHIPLLDGKPKQGKEKKKLLLIHITPFSTAGVATYTRVTFVEDFMELLD